MDEEEARPMNDSPTTTPEPKTLPPTIESEARYRVAEHEIYLSFVNDSDAVMFHDWWNQKGVDLWRKWADKNRKMYE